MAETVSPTGVRTRFSYDSHGRETRQVWTIENELFQLDVSYDSHSRVDKISYPDSPGSARLIVQQIYDANSGRLKKVIQDGTSKTFWELTDTNPEGRIEGEVFGNQVETQRTYEPLSGRLSGITSSRSGSTVQSLGYGYWVDGNLRRRSDLATAQHERFEYDQLDRLKTWVLGDSEGNVVSSGWNVAYTYDDFGNLTHRDFTPGSSTGGTAQNLAFTYGQVRNGGHHAVTSGPWGDYGYDLKGNQTSRPGNETIVYTAFDLPKEVTGPRAMTLRYDAFGRRAVKRKSTTEWTSYVSGIYEKRVTGTATADHVYYVRGPEGVVAQVLRPVVAWVVGTERTFYPALFTGG